MTLPLTSQRPSGLIAAPYSTTVRPVRIAGMGGYAPSRVMTNHDLEGMVETSDEWIVARTGIHARHFALPDQSTSELALYASRHAIEAAGIDPQSIDLIIVATSTPDYVFPSTACLLQDKLGSD